MLFIQARDVLHGQEISLKETLSGISKSTEEILFESKFSLKKDGNYYKVNITTPRAQFKLTFGWVGEDFCFGFFDPPPSIHSNKFTTIYENPVFVEYLDRFGGKVFTKT